MFETKKHAGRWGRDLIVYKKAEKQLIKEYIYQIYQDMKYPDDMTSQLTRINWKHSYIRGSELHITINIAFTCPYKIDHLEYPKFNYFYHSDMINLAIPFDVLLQHKRNKVLEELV